MTLSETKVPRQLDTNILIHAVRGNATWQKIKAVYDPLMAETRPSICVVTEGEIRSFALRRLWSGMKMNQAEFLLKYFGRTSIESRDVMNAYAEIDDFSLKSGVKMGQNDLWIAATASVNGATLITTDKDFEHLHGKFLNRILI